MSDLKEQLLLYASNMDHVLTFNCDEIEAIIKKARIEADKAYKNICESNENYIAAEKSEKKVMKLESNLKQFKEEFKTLDKKPNDLNYRFNLINESIAELRISNSLNSEKLSSLEDFYVTKSKNNSRWNELNDKIDKTEKQIEEERELARKNREKCTIDPKSFVLLDYMYGDEKQKVLEYIDALTKVWINNMWHPYATKYDKLRKLIFLTTPILNCDVIEVFHDEFDKYSLRNKGDKDFEYDEALNIYNQSSIFMENLKVVLHENSKNPKRSVALDKWTIDSCAAIRDDKEGIKLLNTDPLPEDENVMNAFLMLSISRQYLNEILEIVNHGDGIIDTAIKMIGQSENLKMLKQYIID